MTETAEGRRRPLALKTFARMPVDAVYFKTQRALVAERTRVRSASGATFEAAIKPHERFLMERFVTGALALAGVFHRRDGFLRWPILGSKSPSSTTSLFLLAFDIETEGFDGPLLSIAVAGHGGERVWITDCPGAPRHSAYASVADEAALVRCFLDHIATVDPDVISGWNVVEFDLKYLERKATALGIPFTLGRSAERATVLTPRNDGQPHIARVGGRVVLDGIATLRAATFAFESFRLEDVAQSLLGRGKRIEHGGDPVAEIKRLHAEDKPALATYNLEDCRLVLDIFAKADLVGIVSRRIRAKRSPRGLTQPALGAARRARS